MRSAIWSATESTGAPGGAGDGGGLAGASSWREGGRGCTWAGLTMAAFAFCNRVATSERAWCEAWKTSWRALAAWCPRRWQTGRQPGCTPAAGSAAEGGLRPCGSWGEPGDGVGRGSTLEAGVPEGRSGEGRGRAGLGRGSFSVFST